MHYKETGIEVVLMESVHRLDSVMKQAGALYKNSSYPAILTMILEDWDPTFNVDVEDALASIFDNASKWDIKELAVISGFPHVLKVSQKWDAYKEHWRPLVTSLALRKERENIRSYIFGLFDRDFFSADSAEKLNGREDVGIYKQYKLEWIRNKLRGSVKQDQLHDEQVWAIGDTSLNCLLRARAGSGKTTVIKHKVDFMIRHAGLNPEDFMVLAFNKAAAEKVKKELQTEFNHLTFHNSRTFHSLAHQIVLPSQTLLFDIDTGSNASQSQFVESLLKNEINPVVKKDIYEFFRLEMKEIENLGSLLSKEDYYAMRRNEAQDTLNGDPVKSIGEKWIADFLFEHGIRYVYERSWYRDANGEKGNYYPDFSLAVSSKKPDVVIEHWGIDEFDTTQTVPEHWSQSWADYRHDMEIKRAYWREWNARKPDDAVIFLETSIRDTRHGRQRFEATLKELIETKVNVRVSKQPPELLIDKVVKKHTPRLAKMCLQFISKAKKRCLSPETLDRKISENPFSCDKERVFVQLANRIYYRYQLEMQEQNNIDFDDLMSQAVGIIHEKQGEVSIPLTRDADISLNQLKWLMIDEYQDFSELFFNLVQAIRTYNPAVRLFCVGDNWQAINGFAGSDLRYFDQFEQHFEGATLLDLRNNYRSQPNIVQQGNKFMHSVSGEPSEPKAPLPAQPLQTYLTNNVFIEQRNNVRPENNPDYRYLTFQESRGEKILTDIGATIARQFKLCHQLILQHPLASTDFIILSRSNYQAYGYEKLSQFKRKLKSCFSKDELRAFRDFDEQVKCMTAHSSKGAEAEVVIVLNVKKRRFPIIHPDHRLYAVLGDTIDEVYKEEERLFYVAITRAKQSLYIITEIDRESEFLARIEAPVFQFPQRAAILDNSFI